MADRSSPVVTVQAVPLSAATFTVAPEIRSPGAAALVSTASTITDVLESVLGTQRRLQGPFADDTVHGAGSMFFSCGSVFTGRFERGVLHGDGALTLCRGAVLRARWQHGCASAPVLLCVDGVTPIDATALGPEEARSAVRAVLERRGQAVGRGGTEMLSFRARFDSKRAANARAAAQWVVGATTTPTRGASNVDREPALHATPAPLLSPCRKIFNTSIS